MGLIRFPRRRESTLAKQFDELMRPHVPTLFRTAYRYTGRREDAEDLVQDLLVKLYARMPELAQVADLRPWLVRSLYNLFVDRVRTAGRAPELVDVEDEAIEALDDPQHDVLTLEQRSALNAAIDRLNPEHRAVVMLHLVEGHSLPELSAILDVQIGTLKSRLHRARAQLQGALRFMEPKPLEQRVTQHEL
jgi:RNA polymerase sigma factor (sigma-70 family)